MAGSGCITNHVGGLGGVAEAGLTGEGCNATNVQAIKAGAFKVVSEGFSSGVAARGGRSCGAVGQLGKTLDGGVGADVDAGSFKTLHGTGKGACGVSLTNNGFRRTGDRAHRFAEGIQFTADFQR